MAKKRVNGEGTIFQRKDKTWQGSISLGTKSNGKRNRVYVYGKTRKEVREKLQQKQSEYGLAQFTDPTSMTVEGYLLSWVDGTAKSTVSKETYDRYGLVVNKQLIPYLGHIVLPKLTVFHITNSLIEMVKDGHSPRARSMAVTVLHGALKHAVRLKLIAHNPCVDVVKPKVEHKESEVWTQDQVNKFLESARDDRLYAMFVLALDTGARLGELLGLKWADVDLDVGTISIQRSLEEIRGQHKLKEPKTKRGRRHVSLSKHARDVMVDHRKRMDDEGNVGGQVFCDRKGGFLRKSNVTRRNFARIIRRANDVEAIQAQEDGRTPVVLPSIRFHDLRHTCASILLQKGVDVKVVSERLGHETIQITLDTYAHFMPGMQKTAASAMDEVFQSGCKVDESNGNETK